AFVGIGIPYRLTPYRPPDPGTAKPAPSSSKRLARTVAAGRSSARTRSSAERPSSRQSASQMRRASGDISADAARQIADRQDRAPDGAKELGEHGPGAAAEDRPAPQEPVGAHRRRGEDRSGHGEDVATEVAREARRDERARPPRGLDDDDARGEARDDAIPNRKILRPRLRARKVLREEQGIGCQSRLERTVLPRI